jgi:FkbM family methyltransferase
MMEYIMEFAPTFLAEKLKEKREELWNGIIVEMDGVKYFLVDSESFLIISRGFESFVSMWLKPKKGDVLLDIGAHIGRYTLTTAKVVGNEGMVIAVEGHPINFQVLKKNISLNNFKNVIALNIAAWHTNCKLNMFVGDTAGHHSVKIDRGLGFVEVEAKAMDDVLKELSLRRVDWIKIDVEVAEFEVLCGLKKRS